MGGGKRATLAGEFGRVVRGRRLELDLGQRELAEAIGTSQAYISRIEHGLANPTLQTLERLEDVLGIRLVASGERSSGIGWEKVNR